MVGFEQDTEYFWDGNLDLLFLFDLLIEKLSFFLIELFSFIHEWGCCLLAFFALMKHSQHFLSEFFDLTWCQETHIENIYDFFKGLQF